MGPSSQLHVQPIEASLSLRDKIYRSLKDAICSMNIYASDAELRLDERKLSDQLGISRTPLREALARLEQEGLITIVPRRGVFIVRKTRQEILEMITVWAALESMAARLVTQRANDAEIAIEFHQKILELSHCALLRETADGLFLHMRGIRTRTIVDDDRAKRSIVDHMHIIEAIEARDTELAEALVREHALNLAEHVKEHVGYLDDVAPIAGP
jgi:DNA-binding GntR family transcriptional regulator